MTTIKLTIAKYAIEQELHSKNPRRTRTISIIQNQLSIRFSTIRTDLCRSNLTKLFTRDSRGTAKMTIKGLLGYLVAAIISVSASII